MVPLALHAHGVMLEREEHRAQYMLAHRRRVEPARVGENDPSRRETGQVQVFDAGAGPCDPAQARCVVQATVRQLAPEDVRAGQVRVAHLGVIDAAQNRHAGQRADRGQCLRRERERIYDP